MKMVKLEKEEGLISEDEQKEAETEIQTRVDEANKNIETLRKDKDKDVMTV
jgi:ribosome recycling factor